MCHPPVNIDFACIRLRANGSVDGDFLPALISFDLDDQGTDAAYATRLDAQGRIVMAGFASAGLADRDFAVARLLPSGQVNASFGVDRRMTYEGTVMDRSNQSYAIALQSDGKIVLAGSPVSTAVTDYHVQVVRVIGDILF